MANFGWSLPPGAATDPNAPYNLTEPTCEVCGELADREPIEDGYLLCDDHDTADRRLTMDQQWWDERVGEEIHAMVVTGADDEPADFEALREKARQRVIERYGPRPGEVTG